MRNSRRNLKCPLQAGDIALTFPVAALPLATVTDLAWLKPILRLFAHASYGGEILTYLQVFIKSARKMGSMEGAHDQCIM